MGAQGDNDHRIAALAARQHGVVTSRQLRAIGLGSKAITYRVGRGRLIVLHRGVYAVGHDRLTREGRWLAAVLACGAGAALGFRDAGGLWELRAAGGGRIDVIVPSAGGRRPREGIRVHRLRDLRREEVTRRDGLPVTTPARTILDLASVLPAHQLRRIVEQSELLGVFDLRALRAVLDAHAGRPGAPALTALLADLAAHGVTMTRSDLEALVLQLCIDHGLPRPRVNAGLDGRELDFRWEQAGVVVEANGFGFHRSRDAFECDHAKRLALEEAGWTVISVTHRQVVRAPDQLARRLRSVLARR